MARQLLLLNALLAAAAVAAVGGTPLPQYSAGSGSGLDQLKTTKATITKAALRLKPTTVSPVTEATPSAALLKPPGRTSVKNSLITLAKILAKSRLGTESRARNSEAQQPPVAEEKKGAAEKKDATEDVIEKSGGEAPEPITKASPVVEEKIHNRRRTPAGFSGGDVLVLAPICRPLLAADLSPPRFHRHDSGGFTTCVCSSRHLAFCRPQTPFPTVRPGSASAAHAREQSGGGGGVPPALLAAHDAANAFALQHDCQQRQSGGDICQFSAAGGVLHCDCADRD